MKFKENKMNIQAYLKVDGTPCLFPVKITDVDLYAGGKPRSVKCEFDELYSDQDIVTEHWVLVDYVFDAFGLSISHDEDFREAIIRKKGCPNCGNSVGCEC
jgi:hypothetical protein